MKKSSINTKKEEISSKPKKKKKVAFAENNTETLIPSQKLSNQPKKEVKPKSSSQIAKKLKESEESLEKNLKNNKKIYISSRQKC